MSADSQALINKQQVDVNSWRGAWASTKRWREQIKCNLSQHSPQAKRNVSSHNKPQISSSTRGIYVKVYEAYECTYVYVHMCMCVGVCKHMYVCIEFALEYLYCCLVGCLIQGGVDAVGEAGGQHAHRLTV